MAITILLATFGIGLLSGFVGAIAGGGGLISIPFLIFLGIPPQITLATSKFGGIGMSIGGLYKFIRAKKIDWKVLPWLMSASVVASFIGAKFLLSANQFDLQKIIGILLILIVPTIFIKKDFGLKQIEVSNSRKIMGVIIYFALSIIGSFFGGLGALLITTVIFFFGLSMIKANATDFLAFSVMSLIAVIIYMFAGIVNYEVGIALLAGSMVGGYLGAHTAVKKGDKFVKIVFAVIVVASAIKILLK